MAAEQHGVLSMPQLERCGLDRQAVMVRVRAGRLHRIHRGVYAVGHEAISLHGRFRAAVLACGPGAVLSHQSAAVLWGIVEPYEGVPHVTVPGVAPRRHPGIRSHRARSLDPRDVLRREGLRATSASRTLLSLAESVPAPALRRATRQALALRLTSVPWLLDVIARHRGHHGTSALARVVADGHVPTRSELEDVVYELLLTGGLPRPAVNAPLVLDGRRVIPDFLYRDERVVVEADSRRWHDDPLSREDDAERQALLEQHGYRVVRVTWRQAIARRGQTAGRIAAALARG